MTLNTSQLKTPIRNTYSDFNPSKRPPVLVMGVGNVLMTDEGVGIHAIRRLEEISFPKEVEILDGGTGGFVLLSCMEDAEHIIIIDACLDDNPPGTVSVTYPKYSTDFPPSLSAHEIGLRDLVETSFMTDCLKNVVLVTVSVDPNNLTPMNFNLTEPVENALNEVVGKVQEEVNNILSTLTT